MQEYRNRKAEQSTASVPASSAAPLPSVVEAWQTLDVQYNLEDMFEDADKDDSGTMSVKDEYNSYVKTPLSKPGTNILSFWSMSNTTHPTLFAMAMDYLPIQASSVPSERVFSLSAKTDTHKRNQIHPLLMEALQMLKFGR